MLDESGIARLANGLTVDGLGMVILAGIPDPKGEDVLFRCFSTISKEDIFKIMESLAFNLSMRQLDDRFVDELVLETPNEDLNDKVYEIMAEINPDPPIIACVASDNYVAAYALGDLTTIVFGATRMMSIFKSEGDFKMFRYYPSIN